MKICLLMPAVWSAWSADLKLENVVRINFDPVKFLVNFTPNYQFKSMKNRLTVKVKRKKLIPKAEVKFYEIKKKFNKYF